MHRISLCLTVVLALTLTTFAEEQTAETIAAFKVESADQFQDCSLPEDKPISYATVSSDVARFGGGAVAFTLDTSVGPIGMKYFKVDGVDGSDGLSYWVLGDGSGTTVQVRLSQSDWSAWDTPEVRVDWTGWKQIVATREDCTFHDWGSKGKQWGDIKTFAFRMSGKDGKVVLDDITFHKNTAALAQDEVATGPITLTIPQADVKARPMPQTLGGVDWALVNWSGGQLMNDRARKNLDALQTPLVRFWALCPALKVSTGKGEWDWDRFDEQMQIVKDIGAEAVMVCNFTPKWLSRDGTRHGLPTDMEAYEAMIQQLAQHCKDKGYPVKYWEVWNEPDLQGEHVFFRGSVEELGEMYERFARSVRSVYDDAAVGGPATAGANVPYIKDFLKQAQQRGVKVDFISWHCYQLGPDGVASSVEAMRKVREDFDVAKEAKLVIDEWNAPGGGPHGYDSEHAAAGQQAILAAMVNAGLDDSVMFAFIEGKGHYKVKPPLRDEFGGSWGLLTHSGRPKAPYFAMQMFNELAASPQPMPMVPVISDDPASGALAIRDKDGLTLLIHRFDTAPKAADRPMKLVLDGWSDGLLDVKIERIDREHGNPLRDPEATGPAVSEMKNVPAGKLAEGIDALALPPMCVLRVTIRQADGE